MKDASCVCVCVCVVSVCVCCVYVCVCVCVYVCGDDSRRYSVYSSSARSIKPKVLIRLLGLHLGGGDVDIELTQG